MTHTRITTNPEILRGKPCIRGTRLSVEFILELISTGATAEMIYQKYPQLTQGDVEAALHFAAEYLRHDDLLELEIDR